MIDSWVRPPIRVVVVDDQSSQCEYVISNLEAALLAHPVEADLQVIERFDRIEDATRFIQRSNKPFDLLVTDILWPKSGQTTDRQAPRGLEVVRYAARHRPELLIVALTMGDEDHKRIALDALEAGAHIFRFHDADLPGDRGSGWIDLGAEILDRLTSGPPFVTVGSRAGEVYSRSQPASDFMDVDPLQLVGRLCRRFPAFAAQLSARYDKRPGFMIRDEYDVQDLLHAILRLHFSDVRREEPAPSHAATRTRLDLLLKEERVVIEVKMTRPSLSQRRLVEELAIDKERYRSHPDCDAIVFFIYDPEGRIQNAVAVERDIGSEVAGIRTKVIVAPRESGAGVL